MRLDSSGPGSNVTPTSGPLAGTGSGAPSSLYRLTSSVLLPPRNSATSFKKFLTLAVYCVACAVLSVAGLILLKKLVRGAIGAVSSPTNPMRAVSGSSIGSGGAISASFSPLSKPNPASLAGTVISSSGCAGALKSKPACVGGIGLRAPTTSIFGSSSVPSSVRVCCRFLACSLKPVSRSSAAITRSSSGPTSLMNSFSCASVLAICLLTSSNLLLSSSSRTAIPLVESSAPPTPPGVTPLTPRSAAPCSPDTETLGSPLPVTFPVFS